MATGITPEFNWVKLKKHLQCTTFAASCRSSSSPCSGRSAPGCVPIVGNVPPPSSVFVPGQAAGQPVVLGILARQFRAHPDRLHHRTGPGIPLGLLLGVNRTSRELIYPVFEIMRPIPPLAWVPVAVIFWPTSEFSMMFVTFLGAFFTVVLNIVGGARASTPGISARSLPGLLARTSSGRSCSRRPCRASSWA